MLSRGFPKNASHAMLRDMDDLSITFAKEHLEDLIARARRGEVVTINDGRGVVRLIAAPGYDVTAPRVTDTMPPFVPLKEPRKFGLFKGEIPPPPDNFFDPLDEDELKQWYGEGA
jgi:antitoxin (DNA-binding transcriptional repressor) of toxin-antitoxin stability system